MLKTTGIKSALAIVAFGVSSQASFAATDTSCNPFERGANCSGAFAFGSSNGSTFTRFGIVASRGASQSSGVSVVSQRASGFGSILGSLPSQASAQSIDLNEETDFDEAEVLEDVTEVSDDDVSVVPLPASAALLLAGLGGLVAMRRKKS